MKRFFLVLIILGAASFSTVAASETGLDSGKAVFWSYGLDRYKRPVLQEPVEVPPGADAVSFLAQYCGFAEWSTNRRGNVIVVSEKAVSGEIPILCFHKIGRQDRFALSPERFRRLLRYLNKNKWYWVSDYQYLTGDFSRVPTGMKPVVLGADDAGSGNMEYVVKGNPLTGNLKLFADGPRLERNSMVAILEKLAPRENGRINFTFYISFDAIPFRQLGGSANPGFPYKNIPLVKKKIRYLDEHFIVGIHSLSHKYVYKMGIDAFVNDIDEAWELLDYYSGGCCKTLNTMAYPYGVGDLTGELQAKLTRLSRNGRSLAGAFDLDGMYADPPGNPGNLFDVSRINVDNSSWSNIIDMLENVNAVKSQREFIWVTDSKKLPPSPYRLGASPLDRIWVLVQPPGVRKSSKSKEPIN